MGRFDALLNPTKPLTAPTITTEEKARKPASPQEGLPVSPQTRLPQNPQAVKPANPQAHLRVSGQVEKYTTRLEPTLIKQIKQYALQQDMKDYEVVQKAVKEYLAKKR